MRVHRPRSARRGAGIAAVLPLSAAAAALGAVLFLSFAVAVMAQAGAAQLDIQETAPSTVAPGSTATFSFVLKNTGGQVAPNVNVYFYFLNDAGVQYMPFELQGTACEIDTVYRGFTQVHCPAGPITEVLLP